MPRAGAKIHSRISKNRLRQALLGMLDAALFAMDKHNAAFGIYRTSQQVEMALSTLQSWRFSPSSIRTWHRDRVGWQDFAYELRTMVGVGAAIGASIGLIVGLIVGILAFSGTSFILLGAAFGIFFGAMSGALVGAGTPESAAQRYRQYLNDGGILLSVHINDQDEASHAQNILEITGAEDITSVNELKTWRTVFGQLRNLRSRN